jgi:hypothetical protein
MLLVLELDLIRQLLCHGKASSSLQNDKMSKKITINAENHRQYDPKQSMERYLHQLL